MSARTSVRRVLSQLGKAGLVESTRGSGGGTLLARDSRCINLRQVYEAVEPADRDIWGRHAGEVSADCQSAPAIAAYLDELYAEAEEALLKKLAKVSIDEMSRDIVARVCQATSAKKRAAP